MFYNSLTNKDTRSIIRQLFQNTVKYKRLRSYGYSKKSTSANRSIIFDNIVEFIKLKRSWFSERLIATIMFNKFCAFLTFNSIPSK